MEREQRSSDLVTSDYITKLRERVTGDLVTKRNRRNYTESEARSKADYIATKLNNPSRRMFYLKCAWNLTDEYLDRLLRIALTKTDPQRYFSASAAREMRQNA